MALKKNAMDVRRNAKKRVRGPFMNGTKKEDFWCLTKNLQKKPVKLVSGIFNYPYTFLEKIFRMKSSDMKYKIQK